MARADTRYFQTQRCRSNPNFKLNNTPPTQQHPKTSNRGAKPTNPQKPSFHQHRGPLNTFRAQQHWC
eukprot:11178141-Lingulodinium_polyedra.AAC.1